MIRQYKENEGEYRAERKRISDNERRVCAKMHVHTLRLEHNCLVLKASIMPRHSHLESPLDRRLQGKTGSFEVKQQRTIILESPSTTNQPSEVRQVLKDHHSHQKVSLC